MSDITSLQIGQKKIQIDKFPLLETKTEITQDCTPFVDGAWYCYKFFQTETSYIKVQMVASSNSDPNNRIIVTYSNKQEDLISSDKCITSMFPLKIFNGCNISHGMIIPKGNWVCIQVIGQASRDAMKIYRYQLG